jgi:hypothetical protein
LDPVREAMAAANKAMVTMMKAKPKLLPAKQLKKAGRG